MKKRKSIRIRLLEVYVVIMLLVFAINMYIVHSQSQAIRQIDGVYNSNIQLNDISTTLEKMQTSLYQYLNTKSSDELENYYLSNQSSETLVFSRKIGILILVPYVFSLVFALMSRNKGNFLFRFPRPPYQAVLRKFVSLPS